MSEATSEFESSIPQGTENPTEEIGNTFPELIANPPLENTTLIYSVPVMGEWTNGNLLRMLNGMFSQRPRQGEAFELELLYNLGENLDAIVVMDEDKWELKKNEKGKIVLDTNPQGEDQKKAVELLKESNEAIGYLKQIIEAQRLARVIKAQPHDEFSRKQLDDLIEDIADPLLRDIVQLAVKKAETISLVVIDATHTVLRGTDYDYVSFSSLRTLGADIASARFEENPDVVLGLYDADTVPEDNNAVKVIQDIFDQYPDLNYLFSGMTNLPAGYSKGFVGDSPRANVRRMWDYNSRASHQSPQISFRLRAYQKLKEISQWDRLGFHGYEDTDTAIRLIYYFGELQQGLLFESSLDLYPPTSMTTDRLDGSVDSAARRRGYLRDGARLLRTDLGLVFEFREKVNELIQELPYEKQQEVLQTLEKAREHFDKKQKVQQRFNRLVLNTFFDAFEKGLIKSVDGQIQIDDNGLMALTGGNALLHYVRANKQLVDEVLSSQNDLEVMRFYLGRIPNLPDEQVITPFQLAIREYVGDVRTFDTLVAEEMVTSEKKDGPYTEWKADDLRDIESRISLMHSAVAEILALAHTYKIHFETEEFLKSRRRSSEGRFQWPENPDEQKLNMRYKDLGARLKEIRERMDVMGTGTSKAPSTGYSGAIDQFGEGVPIMRLRKALIS